MEAPKPGFLGNLTPEQENMLEELKKRVAEYTEKRVAEGMELTEVQKELLEMDSMYLRFLRGRKWDLEASYNSYIETAEWRRNFQGIGVDNIDETMIENELKTGKCFMYKYDKRNRTIIYVRPRFHDPNQNTTEEMDRFLVWMTELGRKMLRPGVETGLVIYDMNGFGLSNMDYTQVKTQIRILESYYPESMGLTLIVNSPWLFSACWRLIKGWIDPVAAEKIKFISQAELTQYVDPDNLLKDYGGNDPYQFTYETVEERKATGYIPPWEMSWATEWRQEEKAKAEADSPTE
uniref:CRAL-TRIO domain-containing protein n=1 Tax=Vannella robusta TaxID=1487602 RepID=A0A7S4ISL5_9EUKA